VRRMSTPNQNVQVTQIVENKGCLSGCGTAIAVVLVVGLTIQYWYVSVPVAVLGAAWFGYWYYKQRGKLPDPKAGSQDPWLGQIALRVRPLGFIEQTRNTGRHLEGVPMEGDLCLDGTECGCSSTSSAVLRLQCRPPPS
jgi:hypothetical protein